MFSFFVTVAEGAEGPSSGYGNLPQAVTDFFLKINSPCTGRNSGDSAKLLLLCSFCLIDDKIVLIVCHFATPTT